jgi:hypothetical protein
MMMASRISIAKVFKPSFSCRMLSSSSSDFRNATMSDTTFELAKGIQTGTRHCLAKAITLIESQNMEHRQQAKFLLQYLAKEPTLMGKSTPTLRLGIAGPPGKKFIFSTNFHS